MGNSWGICVAPKLLNSSHERKIIDSGKFRVTMSTEEGRWDAHPCGEGACPCGLLYKLCVCTSLPHSGPMQVPTQVSRLATSAKASARVQKLAEPLVKELACCTRHNQPGFVISMVRQHHPGPCMDGTLGRGEGTGAQSLVALFIQPWMCCSP